MLRAGIDVGGTFTDLMLVDDESKAVWVHKVPSTPADPSQATMSGLRELCGLAGIEPERLQQVFHGTTVATNIVLERNGSKTGMITTEGFRDIIYIGRHRRPKTFSIYQDLPWREPTLVERRYRLPVSERIGPPGEIITPLDEEGTRAAARELKEAGVEAVCVCFLFSFLDPRHELRAKEIVAEEFPEAHLSISHEVVPQHREYERFTTTALNAYIGPKTSTYLRSMDDSLREVAPEADFHLMSSNGGTMTIGGAPEAPASLLMSGPVAGLVGGIAAARSVGHDSVVTLDVGGTSADIGVAPDARLRMKHLYDTNVGGYEVMIPMADLDTIGAGGGSIARIDAGGLLRVGPESAGADPGPACYGRGGTLPTATDAQLVLGRLRPGAKLAGSLSLEPELAEQAIGTLAAELGTSVRDAALGAIRILTQNMVSAISVNSVQRGIDPRDLSLVAFGGGGPLYGADIATELSFPRVIIPLHPGITSAMGLLDSDIKYESQETVMLAVDECEPENIESTYLTLETVGRQRLEADAVPPESQRFTRLAECRYVGQAYELLVPVPSGVFDEKALARLAEDFEDAHEREFFYRFEGQPVQVVGLRTYAVGLMPHLKPEVVAVGATQPPDAAIVERRPVVFSDAGEAIELETTVFVREALLEGNVVEGPAIIEQLDSTTLVSPGLSAQVAAGGGIIIDCDTSEQQEEQR
jgi:5-oxoprolinase (ATP-hydrolysing)/N-methylhydantoinase A